MAGRTGRTGRVVLITGASSGIGFQAAGVLARAGHTVYAGARRVERMRPLRALGVTPVALDVTDQDACTGVVETIMAEQGRIDVLVNNAGYGSFGAVEDVDLTEARRQIEVNVLGLAALTRAVLPHMRARRSGTIINMSSMGGRLVTFMGGWYHATKYAVEALSDALRMEVADFGIDVVLIEPGGIRTDWGTIAADHLESSARGGAYEKAAGRVAANMRRLYASRRMSDPQVVVRAIRGAVEARRPRSRYLVGLGAKPLVAAHALLPARLFDRIMRGAAAG
ncbi:oxidoreductase [Actinomyces israelii]|uniref:Oxidoreductase n=1 Tax=Actinomyces israelii TaxID=1659 RepID=A0ABT4I6E9_9ACTO|nr:oxidoreductase [Actinomyces israelii]MCZ0857324.1 oxidoreductase [Actinomyces israelii]